MSAASEAQISQEEMNTHNSDGGNVGASGIPVDAATLRAVVTTDTNDERKRSSSTEVTHVTLPHALIPAEEYTLARSSSQTSLPGGGTANPARRLVPATSATSITVDLRVDRDGSQSLAAQPQLLIDQPDGSLSLATEVTFKKEQDDKEAERAQREAEEADRRHHRDGAGNARGRLGDHNGIGINLYTQIVYLRRKRSLFLLLILDTTFYILQLILYRDPRDESEDPPPGGKTAYFSLLIANMVADMLSCAFVRSDNKHLLLLLVTIQTAVAIVTASFFLNIFFIMLRVIVILFGTQLWWMLRNERLQEAIQRNDLPMWGPRFMIRRRMH